MQWNELICEKKITIERIEEPKEWARYPINEFEKDYKKIIASSAFRRLQDKTQVFPLDKSDFVRTRLTHSMEVSTIAKQLGVMVFEGFSTFVDKNTKEKFPMDEKDKQKICDILMCAGLLHDLGNPPFGHFGETVIGEWFREKLAQKNFIYNGKKVSDFLDDQMRQDLENFEGNAQSLRLLLKACNDQSASDLNLTNVVIHTLMKYPTDSNHFEKDDPDISKHKNGYFLAEEEQIQKIAVSLNTMMSTGIVRHPLTFLLEAADDIAYATADLEDAFKKGLFTLDQFVAFYDTELSKLKVKHAKDTKSQATALIDFLRDAANNTARTRETDAIVFNEWVKYARGWLMYGAAFGFVHNYTSIMTGEYPHDLFFNTFHEYSIKALKNAMVQFAFHSDSIVKLELSAQTMITFLLDKFVPAVLYFEEDKEKGKQSAADRKYTDLISENHKNDYRGCKQMCKDGYNLYLRFLMVTDYISGMTDSFAKNLYQELNGIL